MKKIQAFAVAALLLLQNSPALYALEAATVESVRVSADNVYVTTDRPVEYKTFMMAQPAKLVLELQDSKLRTLQEIPVGGNLLRKVRTGQFEPAVSRVVMELTRKTTFEVTRRGNELIVLLGERINGQAVVKDAPAARSPKVVKIIAPDGKPAEKRVELTLESNPVKPADLNRESAPVITPKKRYTSSGRNIIESLSREPITFDYNEADVREVLDMMAVKAGVNIIYGDDVSGTVTMSLAKVPFSEAFEMLLSVKGLAAQQVGDNILRIASPKTLVSEQRSAMLQTRVFFLSYINAGEMKTQVDAVVAAEGRNAKCSADAVNNALIITDTPMGLEATARFIRSLDRMPKQVMIEAKLVEVALSSTFDLGVKWSNATGPNYRALNTNVDGIDRKIEVGEVNNKIFGAFTFGKLTANSMLNAAITAAASKGKAKVLSDPKVATLNNKEANINITSQIPYDVCQFTGTGVAAIKACNTVYSSVGITLKVTPTINPDGHISMKVVPNVSQTASSYVEGSGVAPGIDTRSADTSVIVKDGETIVIGGLIHDYQNESVTKVPLLGDIPLLGLLFRHKTMSRSRMELLIFVTPRIIEE